MLFQDRSDLSVSLIQLAGHAFAHRPQPTQRLRSISAQRPFTTAAARFGQTDSQVPQATQTVRSASAYRLDAI